MAVFSYPGKDELADALSNEFQRYLAELNLKKKLITLALSGGNTPVAFYEKLASIQNIPGKRTDWSRVHIFWADERCVPPGHPESNYTLAERHLLSRIGLDNSHIHRIRGENEPNSEALRCSDEIRHVFNIKKGIPVFSWIFLGMGEDGHTASIFPDRPDLIRSEAVYETARHPLTGQYRITMTGPVIMAAERTSYLVTGEDKSTLIRQIFNHESGDNKYPAGILHSAKGRDDWYLDAPAAKQLKL